MDRLAIIKQMLKEVPPSLKNEYLTIFTCESHKEELGSDVIEGVKVEYIKKVWKLDDYICISDSRNWRLELDEKYELPKAINK
jgi:hypothetical protein